MDTNAELREQLARALTGADAHMSFEEAVTELPDRAIDLRPPNVGYTVWHLIEHLRITQWDMLQYVRDPGHVSPDWPAGYWPAPDARATPAQCRASIEAYLADRATLEAIVRDPVVDPLAPMPHAREHSVARCVRIIANHDSYHVGELAILRQVTGTWGPSHS